jgi:UDP:flavonoid glycosyltransferase YjiC (YdhE family)
MRVLVTTTCGTGHIYPVVPIAEALRRAGHHVVWATAARSCAVVERFGFSTRPAGIDPGERTRRFIEAYPDIVSAPAPDRRPRGFAGLFADIAAPVMLADLAPIFEDVQPDLVVHEVAELGVAPLATRRSVLRIVVGYSGKLPHAVVAAAANALGPVWDAYSLPVPQDIGLYAHEYLHPFAPALRQRPDTGSVRDVRPVSAEPIDTGDDLAWIHRLGNDRPLIYATYWTEMGTRAPWETLLTALAVLDVDAIVTTGHQVDLAPIVADLDAPTRARIHVRPCVSQAAVLPRAAVVVSHAGAGTMLGAGTNGIPQLALPMSADQFANADAFTTAGAAVTLDATTLNPDSVAQQIGMLLHNDSLRSAAAQLAVEFAAMPHPDNVLADVRVGHT